MVTIWRTAHLDGRRAPRLQTFRCGCVCVALSFTIWRVALLPARCGLAYTACVGTVPAC